MGLLWQDNMLSYGSTSDLSKRWGSNSNTSVISYVSNEGPDSDGVIKATASAGATLTGQLFAQPPSTIIGGRLKFKMAAIGTGSAFLSLSCQSSVGSAATWSLGTNSTTGVVYATVGSAAAVAYTGTTNIADNNWHVIEWQTDLKDASGTIKVWVDGVLEINATGDMFSGTAHATTPWTTNVQLISGSAIRWFKDIVVFDSSGIAGCLRTQEQPYGNLRMKTVRPSGAGSSTQFTPSAGSNFQNVDEQAQDGATTYNQSATSGHRDLFAMANLPETPTALYGVVQNTFAENPGGGTISFKQVLKSGATTDVGSAQVANLIGDYYMRKFDVDPLTSAAWTEANFNALESGYEVA